MRAISAEAHTKSDAEGAAAGPLADAPRSNWVDRFAPNSLKPWLRLVRADRPIGAWLLMWPCWWSVALSVRAEDDFVDLWSDIRLLLLFMAGAFVMRSAGCIYNDIIDRDIDAKVARTKGRPLASGQISLGAAIACTLALCLVGLAILLQFNTFAVALGFGSVGIVLIYPLMKRVTFWPQAVLGLAFSYGALMGWAAYWGDLAVAPIVLYAASIAWTIGYDTILCAPGQGRRRSCWPEVHRAALRKQHPGLAQPVFRDHHWRIGLCGMVHRRRALVLLRAGRRRRAPCLASDNARYRRSG